MLDWSIDCPHLSFVKVDNYQIICILNNYLHSSTYPDRTAKISGTSLTCLKYLLSAKILCRCLTLLRWACENRKNGKFFFFYELLHDSFRKQANQE